VEGGGLLSATTAMCAEEILDAREAWMELVGERAAEIARLIPLWFEERRAWLQTELRSRAAEEHIDLAAWVDHPIVRATGLRGRTLPRWDGAPDQFFVLIDTKGGE